MFLNVLLFLTFFLFSFGQIGRMSFINGQVNFYLYEVLMVILSSALFFKYRLTPIKESLKKFKVFYIFIAILFFSFLINIGAYTFLENVIAFLYLLRLTFYFVYFFYLSYWVAKEHRQKVLFKGILLFIALTLLSSIVQYFLYPDLRNLFYLGWDPHLYRLFGLFFDTSTAGAIYGVSFLMILLNNVHKGDKGDKGKWGELILLCIFLIFIVLTFSRSLYLAFGITMLFIFIRGKSWLKLLGLSLIFVLLVVLAPKPTGEGVNLGRVFSVNSRLVNYGQAIALWQKNPIFGIGYNHIRYGRDSFAKGNAGASFHSSFLIILATGGVLGLFGWLGTLVKLGKDNPKIIPIIIFLSILSMTDNILLHSFVLFYLFTLDSCFRRNDK